MRGFVGSLAGRLGVYTLMSSEYTRPMGPLRTCEIERLPYYTKRPPALLKLREVEDGRRAGNGTVRKVRRKVESLMCIS